MLKIRLQRIGRKNDPAFRVVVTESTRGPKSGKYVELLGSYNPRQHVRTFKAERIKHWISQGAQVSGTVHNLLISENIIEGNKINVLPRKSPVIKEESKPNSTDARQGGEKGSEEETKDEAAEEKVNEETASEEESAVNEEEVKDKSEAPAPSTDGENKGDTEEAKGAEKTTTEDTPVKQAKEDKPQT